MSGTFAELADFTERRRRARLQDRMRQLGWRLPRRLRDWLFYLYSPIELPPDVLLIAADMLDEWRAAIVDTKPDLACDLNNIVAALRDEAPRRARRPTPAQAGGPP